MMLNFETVEETGNCGAWRTINSLWNEWNDFDDSIHPKYAVQR